MERVLSDVRLSLRIFRRSPALALSAVIALAMGIGFTTTMFSIVRGGTQSLPFERPEQLLVLTRTVPRYGQDLDPGLFDYQIWRRQQQSFEAIAAFEDQSVNIGGDEQRPERRSATRIAPEAFALLRVQPMLGRLFGADDARPGAPAVVLLGYDLWRVRFAADSGIVGRVVRLDGQPHTVIGVMPPRFGFPVRSALWTPLVVAAEPDPVAGSTGMHVFGRLRDGVSRGQATAELATIAERLAREQPATHENRSARAYPFVELEMAANTPTILYLMLGAVTFVLLIASANVANLLLARAALRTREVAVRTALGASRARLVIQQVAESLALSAVGGVLGVGIAQVAVRGFDAATAGILDAFWIDFRVDGTVLLFAATMIALSGLVAGLVPGIRASATNPAETLKDASGGATGLRLGRLARGLVLAEVTLATGFLIMTMTITKTAVALRALPLPFPAREVFTGQLGLPPATMGDVEQRNRIIREVTARVEAVPGISAAALVSVLPGRGAGNWSFSVDQPAAAGASVPTTGLALVTPGFFDVVGARVLRGRTLDWRDDNAAPPVALVNESWVRRYSADRDPIGRTVWFGERSLQIVGVAPDLQMQDPGDEPGDGVYASILQLRPYTVRVMARTRQDPLAALPPVRDAIEAVDPDVPLFEVASLHEAIYADKKVLDAFGALFFVFGLGALFLTMLGVYGVVSFAVARRSREIGVRVALGASRGRIMTLILGQGMRLIGIGTAAGLVLAFALSRALAAASGFFQAAGPLTYLAIAAALLLTAAAALTRPVRQALALEPTEALRQE